MNNKFILFILSAGIIFSGCTMKDTALTPSEAEKKLVEFCQKEGSLGTVSKEEFSDADLDTNLLWDDLVKNGYINSQGQIQIKFCQLEKPSKMTLSPQAIFQKDQAYAILKKASFVITTRMVGKTLWIYTPFNEPIFTVKPSGTSTPREKKNTPLAVLYIGGQYNEKKD